MAIELGDITGMSRMQVRNHVYAVCMGAGYDDSAARQAAEDIANFTADEDAQRECREALERGEEYHLAERG